MSVPFLTTFILIFGYVHGDNFGPIVHSKVGIIRGLQATDGEYYMFLGIPFAKVNESNPFGISSPYPKFEKEYEAIEESTGCPRADVFTVPPGFAGTLDCLKLNIYVPSTAGPDNHLPVMVWIYGGGFTAGSGQRGLYGPRYLVKHDVILVSINYRLGPYGFMNLNTPEVPGNQGLKDQSLALRWVKDNIDAFGGDADKITIFGESAGSISVDLQLYFQKEKLFSQAILQSASALLLFRDTDTSAAIKLAKHLGFSTNDASEALSFLSKMDPNRVIAATTELKLEFYPTVEKQLEGVENFIPTNPINVDVLKAKNIPIMMGCTDNEYIFWYVKKYNNTADNLRDVFDKHLKISFNFEEQERAELEEIVRNFYIGDDDFTDDSKWGIIDFASDIIFNHPAERSFKKYLDNGATNIFKYVFSHNGGLNFLKRWSNISDIGAAHADELGYLFNNKYFTETPNAEDQILISRMTTLWTNFAKYGNPTPETTELLPVQWKPATRDNSYYLNIGSELQLKSRPFSRRMAFWDLFYKNYGKLANGQIFLP